MKQKTMVVIIIFLLVLSLGLVVMFTNQNVSNYGKLYINEIMVSNVDTISDEDGEYSDYIELYNGYDFDIDLTGYHLSDKEYQTSKYVLPNVTIKAKSYLLIFASGKDKYDEYIHTNFKLNKDGETVTLSDDSNNILSKVKYGSTLVNTSYGYNGRKYVYYYKGTPNLKNEGKTSDRPITIHSDNPKLKITEYITDNKIVYDSMGNYSPMIEIYNYGKDVNLKGMYLSDSDTNNTKYQLPDVTIKKDEYLVIYLSGKDMVNNNEIHANFKIKSGEKITISNQNAKVIDSVVVKELPLNTSYGLYEDKWYYYPTPMFGKLNSTKGFETLGGLNE